MGEVMGRPGEQGGHRLGGCACHAPTPRLGERGGMARDWDSLTSFFNICGPISYIIS